MDLERGKCLDLTTLEEWLFESISFFTQLFITFTFYFMKGSADLPLNQHDKDKRLKLEKLKLARKYETLSL